jgi:hypothetical protein
MKEKPQEQASFVAIASYHDQPSPVSREVLWQEVGVFPADATVSEVWEWAHSKNRATLVQIYLLRDGRTMP